MSIREHQWTSTNETRTETTQTWCSSSRIPPERYRPGFTSPPIISSGGSEPTPSSPTSKRVERCRTAFGDRLSASGPRLSFMGDPDQARLDEMIAEAIVDCYTDDEAVTGFATMIEDHLELPFTTRVLGIEVAVRKIDQAADGSIVAVCTAGRERQRIDVLDLPMPEPPPAGAEWIAAYRCWLRGWDEHLRELRVSSLVRWRAILSIIASWIMASEVAGRAS